MKTLAKRTTSIVLAILLMMSCFMVSAWASEDLEYPPIEEATFNEDIGGGIGLAIFENQTAGRVRATTVSKTGYGYFYLIASGDRLGDFNLKGTFSYTGSSVTITGATASVSNIVTNWSITCTTNENQQSTTYAIAEGSFTLNHNGTVSAAASIQVSCTQNGTTTVVFNGS
jgi:hypothetical protein